MIRAYIDPACHEPPSLVADTDFDESVVEPSHPAALALLFTGWTRR
jgi:hypothetical protein